MCDFSDCVCLRSEIRLLRYRRIRKLRGTLGHRQPRWLALRASTPAGQSRSSDLMKLRTGSDPMKLSSWLKPPVTSAGSVMRSRCSTTRRRSTYRPLLESLEDRSTPSIAFDVALGPNPPFTGNQVFGGSLGTDFDVVQPIVISQLGAFDSGQD